MMNDEKLKIEYEFKQKNETNLNQINILRIEFEQLQASLNEK